VHGEARTAAHSPAAIEVSFGIVALATAAIGTSVLYSTMGNQLPTRCVVPCNPVCCAMCMNPGRLGNESEQDFDGGGGSSASANGKNGGVFANAASVLAVAAEEISLDDQLEKELANEVELWRMETSGAAIQKSLQEGGLRGLAGLRGQADLQTGIRFNVPFDRDRSLSPPSRTQVSLHDRAGLGPPSTARTSDRKEVVDSFVSTPPTRPRGSAGVHARTVTPIPRSEAPPMASNDADAAAGSVNWAAAAADAAAGGPKEEVSLRGRSPAREGCSSSARQRQQDVPLGDADGQSDDGAAPRPLFGRGLPGGGGGGGSGTAEDIFGALNKTKEHSSVAVAGASSCVADGVLDESSERTLVCSMPTEEVSPELPPQPPRREHVDVEASSSSDESTFAGFIEDPLERERSAEVHVWFGGGPQSSLPVHNVGEVDAGEAAMVNRDPTVDEAVHSDRSLF